MTIDSATAWHQCEKSTSDGDKKAKINEMITALNALIDHDHLPSSSSREEEPCSITQENLTGGWTVNDANMTVHNDGATDFSISFLCHLKTVKEGKSLNIYDILLDVRDAAEGDEVDAVYLYCQYLDGSSATIWSGTTLNWNSQGLRSCRTDSDLTTEDVSSYDIISVYVETICTNTSGLNFRVPVIDHYYA